MIRFHKNGVTLIEDVNGTLHLIDSKESLRDVARYVWHEESLASYRIDGNDSWPGEKRDIKLVQLTPIKEERLRSMSDINEDSYYSG